MNAIDFVLCVIDALDRLSIRYMAVGSFSSNVYGQPRSTKDADFVIELGAVPISKLAAEIGEEFVLDPQMSFESVTGTTRYRLKHRLTSFTIELFQLSTDPHDQKRFERRVHGDIGGRQAYVPTAEDVIITKLRWYALAHRPKDRADVEMILAVQSGQMDLDYMRNWCDQHQTRPLLEQLLLESRKFEPENP
jgi:hypothetical protein